MIILKPQRGGQTTGGCKINSSAPPAVLGLSSFAEHFGTLGIVFPHQCTVPLERTMPLMHFCLLV